MKNNIKYIRCKYHHLIMRACYRLSLVLCSIHTFLKNVVVKHNDKIDAIIGK